MTGNQTVPGLKTFSAGLVGPYVAFPSGGVVYTALSFSIDSSYKRTTSVYGDFQPIGPNSANLGGTNATWKDFYISGKIKPNASGYGLTLPSTSGWVADKKIATEDDIANVMEVAEGKCNTFVLSGEWTKIEDGYLYDYSGTRWPFSMIGKIYVWNSETEQWENKKTEIANGDYGVLNLFNHDMLSQDSSVGITYTSSTVYLLCTDGGSVTEENFYLICLNWDGNDGISRYPLKVGDIILITQTNFPDRWVSDARDYFIGRRRTYFRILETSKVDLDSYYNKGADIVPTAPGFDIGDSTHAFNQVWASYIQNLTQLYLGVNGLSIVKLNYTSGSDSYSVELGSNKSSIRLTSKEARPTYQYYTTDATSELHTLPVDNDVYSSLGVDPYDNTAQYAVGDLVAYLYKVYRCTTAISVPEDFDSDHWTEVLLAPLAYDAVTKSGAQDIPGVKSFVNGFRVGDSFLITEEVSGHRTIFTISGGPLHHEEVAFGLNISNKQTFLMTPIPIDNAGTWDIGASNRKWRDIYIARYLTDGTNQVQISEISKTKLYKHTIPLPNGYVGTLIAITKDNTSYTDFSDSTDGLAQRTDLLSKAVSIRISISGAISQGNNCPVYDFNYSMGYIGSNGAATVNFDNYVFVDTIVEI